MAWQVREGHEHNFIDGRTHVHHVHFFNRVTGGEHELQLLLGCPKCPACQRPFKQSDLSTLDPAAEINKTLSHLMANHNALMDYAARHGHAIRLGPLANHVPHGHKIVISPDSTRHLHVPRAK